MKEKKNEKVLAGYALMELLEQRPELLEKIEVFISTVRTVINSIVDADFEYLIGLT